MNNLNRLNEYRVMWVMVFFDLPTETKKDRRNYTLFRKRLEKDGFTMFQFSIYLRHCNSRENAEVHIKRVKTFLPPHGHVGILRVTDKQFGMMELFIGKKESEKPEIPQQLSLF
jgi:CRISPR-associated protein Cas2